MARALIALLACWAAGALAQPMADPTRPPSVVDPATGSAGVAQAPASALQSVILRPGAKPRALLGGTWIELGQEYNGARLVKVTETSVTLKGPAGRETLYLTPDAEKRMVKTEPERRRGSDVRETK